jgi:hypothetical protein
MFEERITPPLFLPNGSLPLLGRLLVAGSLAICCFAQSSSSGGSSSGGASTGSSPAALGQTAGNGAASNTTFFESQMLSYGALDPLAEQIATEVCGSLPPGTHLVLFDTTSFLTVQQYRSFQKELGLLTDMFNSFVTPPPEKSQAALGGPSLQVAEGIFQTLSGVIGASTADKNSTFPLSDIAIAMTLSKHLKGCNRNLDVTYPRIALSENPAKWKATEDAIDGAVNNLFKAQRAAAHAAQSEENAIKDRDLRTGTPGATGTAGAGSAQSTTVNTPFGSPLAVTVKDGNGNSLGGVPVTFTSPGSGASGTFPAGGNTVTVTTNGSGVAATTITANRTAGAFSVAATVAGLPNSTATFTLTNTASQPASIAVAGPAAAAAAATSAAPTLPGALPRSVMGSDYLALTGATGLLNQFLSSYGLPASGTGVAPISPVLIGAQLTSLLNRIDPDASTKPPTDHPTYIVFWESSAAGGTQRDRKNLLTNVFTGDWISYSGGTVLSFGMIDVRSGALLLPAVHRFMTPYTTFKDPPKNLLDGVRKASDFEPAKK